MWIGTQCYYNINKYKTAAKAALETPRKRNAFALALEEKWNTHKLISRSRSKLFFFNFVRSLSPSSKTFRRNFLMSNIQHTVSICTHYIWTILVQRQGDTFQGKIVVVEFCLVCVSLKLIDLESFKADKCL